MFLIARTRCQTKVGTITITIWGRSKKNKKDQIRNGCRRALRVELEVDGRHEVHERSHPTCQTQFNNFNNNK